MGKTRPPPPDMVSLSPHTPRLAHASAATRQVGGSDIRDGLLSLAKIYAGAANDACAPAAPRLFRVAKSAGSLAPTPVLTRARARARRPSIGQKILQVLVLPLMVVFGFVFLRRTFIPWIRRTLHESRVVAEVRARRGEAVSSRGAWQRFLRRRAGRELRRIRSRRPQLLAQLPKELQVESMILESMGLQVRGLLFLSSLSSIGSLSSKRQRMLLCFSAVALSH